jgi:phosphohistidine phosphatase
MQVYLVRHGSAVEIGDLGVTRDADRMLSRDGREKTKEVAQGLLRVPDFKVSRIVSSPLIRARETADIIAGVVAPDCKIRIADEMKPGMPPNQVAAWLRKQPPAPTMLVGHMPDLGHLASCLVCSSGIAEFQFKKTAVLCVSCDGWVMPGECRIEWLLQPGILRKLARQTD